MADMVLGKVFRIGTVRYNWPMSVHASQAFSIAYCTDSEDLLVLGHGRTVSIPWQIWFMSVSLVLGGVCRSANAALFIHVCEFTSIHDGILSTSQDRAFSLPGQFAPRSESANRTLANSLPGLLAPWPIRSLALSLPGLFAPGNESSMELSLL